MRIFKDSTTPRAISLGGTDGVLAYENGDYAWSAEQILKFGLAGKEIVRIDVNGSAPTKASILDVERYDATPEIAKRWVPARNAYRHDATIYCERSNLDELFSIVTEDPFWLIIADWTGQPHIVDMPLPKNVHMAGTQFVSIPNCWDATCIAAEGWHPRLHRDWTPLR